MVTLPMLKKVMIDDDYVTGLNVVMIYDASNENSNNFDDEE